MLRGFMLWSGGRGRGGLCYRVDEKGVALRALDLYMGSNTFEGEPLVDALVAFFGSSAPSIRCGKQLKMLSRQWRVE